MSGNHFVSTDGNNLALVFDKGYNNGQTIEFCEVFLFDFELLAIKFDGAVDVVSCLDEYFFVLSCEHLGHFFDVIDVLCSWSG